MAYSLGTHTRTSFIQGTVLRARRSVAARCEPHVGVVSARYRGHGTDFSKVEGMKRHESDSGSAEVQIARLSARVTQLTSHLQTHAKDYATRRGLMSILSQRKQLLLYLQRTNRQRYDEVCVELGIRPLKNDA